MADQKQLMEMCQASGEEERLQGIKGLADLGIEHFMPQLYRALGDESWRLRKKAAELFLGLPTSGQLSNDIIELLHSQDNAGLRNTAVDILVRLGRCAVPSLIEELSCPDHDVRKFVLDILGAGKAEDAVPQMLECLSDPDSNVRAAAAENLGRMRISEAGPRLLEAMGDADLMLRFTILEALAQIGTEVPVASLLAYRDEPLLRQALFDCLGHVGNGDALTVLFEGLTDSMRNTREASCLAIEQITRRHPDTAQRALMTELGPESVEALADLLECRQIEVRRAAVHLLGWVGNDKTASRLLPLLGEEELSRDAASALIAIGRESTCSLTSLWPTADSQTRSYLAYILGEAGCAGCEDLLLEAMEDSFADLQQAAAHALGLVGGERSPAALAARLVDCDLEVVETLVQSLSRLAGKFHDRILDEVNTLLNQESDLIRSQAVHILGALHGDKVEGLLAMALKDVSAAVRSAAVKACEGRNGETLWDALMMALADEQPEIRRLAVEVIGGSRRVEAIEALRLAMQDDDLWVRASAVRSLSRIGDASAVPLLDQALTDPVGLVVIAALETFGDIDPELAYPRLVSVLAHSDEEVVNSALKQLAYSGRADWISEMGAGLINHRNWEVRLAASRTLAELAPEEALALMEERLPIEGEDLVRHQLGELIEALRALQG